MQRLHLAAALLPLALLAACGGGSDGHTTEPPPPATNDVPATALASPDALARYVGTLAVDDRAEPLALPSAALPVSDTTEPAPLP